MVQWVRLSAFTAGSGLNPWSIPGLVPGPGTKIPASWVVQPKKKKRKKKARGPHKCKILTENMICTVVTTIETVIPMRLANMQRTLKCLLTDAFLQKNSI